MTDINDTTNPNDNPRPIKPGIIKLPTFRDSRGCLSVIEGLKDIPFNISRAFWIYNVPENFSRAGHAHRIQSQIIIPVAGSFTVTTDNGETKQSFLLDNPSEGLLIGPLTWVTIADFSQDAVALVLASAPYDTDEYIRDYNDFISLLTKLS